VPLPTITTGGLQASFDYSAVVSFNQSEVKVNRSINITKPSRMYPVYTYNHDHVTGGRVLLWGMWQGGHDYSDVDNTDTLDIENIKLDIGGLSGSLGHDPINNNFGGQRIYVNYFYSRNKKILGLFLQTHLNNNLASQLPGFLGYADSSPPTSEQYSQGDFFIADRPRHNAAIYIYNGSSFVFWQNGISVGIGYDVESASLVEVPQRLVDEYISKRPSSMRWAVKHLFAQGKSFF